MGHSITAIVIKDKFDAVLAEKFDLFPVNLKFGLTLFHVDHYYSACWQYLLKTKGRLESHNTKGFCFPNEMAIAEIIKSITNLKQPEFAIIVTDYFGGFGTQCANVFKGDLNADKNVWDINQAMRYLGVIKEKTLDEFDTLGFSDIRRQPDYLEKYVEMAEEFGV